MCTDVYSGLEERYLGRLITSRLRFDSGTRNNKKNPGTSARVFLIVGEVHRANCLALVGIEQSEPCDLSRARRGREYLDFYERSEIKSLVTRDRIFSGRHESIADFAVVRPEKIRKTEPGDPLGRRVLVKNT